MFHRADPVVAKPMFPRPLPLVRRGAQRRIEVFSPKLGRRLSLSSYAGWQLWLALEANPAVSTFCERPTYIESSATERRVVDFWVQLHGPASREFWILDGADDNDESDVAQVPPDPPDQLQGLPVRRIARSDFGAWTTPVANWAKIVPYLVVWRRFTDIVLAQSIVVYLGRSHTLDDILSHFAAHDAPMVEAALYS